MAVMDEFKEERAAIKNAPFKQKVEYFMDYYKWHVVVGILALILVVSIIVEVTNNKETVFYAGIVNAYMDDEALEVIQEGCLSYIEMDTSSQEIILDTSFYLDYETTSGDHVTYLQKLVTLVSTGTLDALAADEVSFAHMAYSSMLMDIETVLTDEELELYADRLVYIDLEVLEEIEALNDVGALSEEYPEYIIGSAEDMSEPMAVGFYIVEGTNLGDNLSFTEDVAVIGIVANAENLDNAKAFIEYALLEGE